jgi:hypothetical protein
MPTIPFLPQKPIVMRVYKKTKKHISPSKILKCSQSTEAMINVAVKEEKKKNDADVKNNDDKEETTIGTDLTNLTLMNASTFTYH